MILSFSFEGVLLKFTILNCLRFALDELWHPAATAALERALHPAGHGPNSSSLLRPQAAVVAVAISAEELFLFRSNGTPADFPVTHFHGEESRREAAAAAPAFCGSGGAAGSFLRTAEPSQSRLRRAGSPKGGAFGDAVKFPVSSGPP